MSEKTEKMASGQCLGEEFYITKFWKFHVVFLDKDYDTYQQMQDAIERANAAEKAKKKTKINVEIMTDKGKVFTVTSIHAGHGHIVTKPKSGRYEDNLGNVYPPVAWIKEAMDKAKDLQGQAARIIDAIEQFLVAMPGSYRLKGYGGYDSPEEYVEGEIRKAQLAAEETNLDECLGSAPPKRKIRV